MRSKSELEIIPGVGKIIAGDLNRLGIIHIEQLRNKNPQKLKWWNWKD